MRNAFWSAVEEEVWGGPDAVTAVQMEELLLLDFTFLQVWIICVSLKSGCFAYDKMKMSIMKIFVGCSWS